MCGESRSLSISSNGTSLCHQNELPFYVAAFSKPLSLPALLMNFIASVLLPEWIGFLVAEPLPDMCSWRLEYVDLNTMLIWSYSRYNTSLSVKGIDHISVLELLLKYDEVRNNRLLRSSTAKGVKGVITLWLWTASEIYRPSVHRLSTKLVPTFADRGYCVVGEADPYDRIVGFLDRSSYFFFQVAPQLYSRDWMDGPCSRPTTSQKIW
jgi:hypothetical protein